MTGTRGPGHLLTDRLDLRAMTSGDVAALHPSCWGRGYATELARAAQREAAAAEPDLPVVAWIHEQNASSQAVARHLGLSDFGQLKPQHWDGAPMHCWADRQPAPGQDPGLRPAWAGAVTASVTDHLRTHRSSTSRRP